MYVLQSLYALLMFGPALGFLAIGFFEMAHGWSQFIGAALWGLLFFRASSEAGGF
jgi:hypothetical protein